MDIKTSVDIVLSYDNEPEAIRKLKVLQDAGLLGDVTIKLRSYNSGNVIACWNGEDFLGYNALSKEFL